jgi:EAL domain-containing protein (putative c-di-GMP-specific phosphodiesterase class I)
MAISSWSQLGKNMIPRFIGCLAVVIISWIGIFLLDMHIRDNWIREIHTLSGRSAVFTKAWLDKKSDFIEPLAKDAHVRTALNEGNALESREVKKAFYTFGYLNNLPNVYLFSKDSPEVLTKTASAKPLPLPILNELAGFFGSGSMHTNKMILGELTQFLSASAIYNSAGSYIGYVAYAEPVNKALIDLRTPLRNMLGQYDFSVYYQNTSEGFLGLEQINERILGPKIILSSRTAVPLFETAKKTGIFEDGQHEKSIISVSPVAGYPKWRIAVSRPISEISLESPGVRSMVKAATLIAVVLILLVGTRQNNPITEAIRIATAASRSKKANKNKKPSKNTVDASEAVDRFGDNMDEHGDSPKKKKSVIEDNIQRKLEKIPPSEAEIVYTIKTCLRNKQLKFLYQPVIDGVTKVPIMYEIYLRMLDEDGDVLQPAAIFPVAEKNDLSSAIDECVVATAIERHLKNNRLATPLAINLTGATFDSISFVETLIKDISTKHIHGTKLIFELRSREIIEDKEGMKFIRKCHDLGCKFSIDYFGGGEKTIAAAKKLKFDYIKVDGLKFDPQKASVEKMAELKEVADACIKHDLPLVMEKIETNEQINLCKRLRIPYIQGYKIAKPQTSL